MQRCSFELAYRGMKYIAIIFLALMFSSSPVRAQSEQTLEDKKSSDGKIILRDMGSIPTDRIPLYVVEGFILKRNELFNIEAKHIKSIKILKGTAATALYGSEATYGVIIVKLKKEYARCFKLKEETRAIVRHNSI